MGAISPPAVQAKIDEALENKLIELQISERIEQVKGELGKKTAALDDYISNTARRMEEEFADKLQRAVKEVKDFCDAADSKLAHGIQELDRTCLGHDEYIKTLRTDMESAQTDLREQTVQAL